MLVGSASATHLVAAQSNQSNDKYCMLQGMPGSKTLESGHLQLAITHLLET